MAEHRAEVERGTEPLARTALIGSVVEAVLKSPAVTSGHLGKFGRAMITLLGALTAFATALAAWLTVQVDQIEGDLGETDQRATIAEQTAGDLAGEVETAEQERDRLERELARLDREQARRAAASNAKVSSAEEKAQRAQEAADAKSRPRVVVRDSPAAPAPQSPVQPAPRPAPTPAPRGVCALGLCSPSL